MIDAASAALRLVTVRLLVATVGAVRTHRLVTARQGRASDPAGAERAARAVERAARRLPFTTNCLDRSLALAWALRAANISAVVRFGVRRDEAALAAHAWVEHEGVPLLDDGPAHFTPLRGSR